jgi:hypothetical protein
MIVLKQILGSIAHAISAVLFILAHILRCVAEVCEKVANSCFKGRGD